ncbi:MAG: hypothetical protein GXO14_01125 [Thermococci archaeon]|nr:hypothetical protein [Thermococci archaeon]
MKERVCTVKLHRRYRWDNLKLIISDPGRTLKFFPYFKELRGNVVTFEVPRWVFRFGYDFKLRVSFKDDGAVYVFTGDRGVLTVEFTMTGSELEVRARWSGFGEVFMGGPLREFACGIAKAIKEFCSSQAVCPVITSDKTVENVTAETAPALIKMTLWETGGKDFVLRGTAEDGTVIEAKVVGGRLVELRIRGEDGRESILETDVSVLDLTPDIFKDLPLGKKFSLRVEPL